MRHLTRDDLGNIALAVLCFGGLLWAFAAGIAR